MLQFLSSTSSAALLKVLEDARQGIQECDELTAQIEDRRAYFKRVEAETLAQIEKTNPGAASSTDAGWGNQRDQIIAAFRSTEDNWITSARVAELFARLHKTEINRNSLSSQMSALKNDGLLVRNHRSWALAERVGGASLSP